ncbi:type I-E CRISPR-associated protein Cse1/CasA [Brachybacterium hainanense]|uniref:Type I-E CRISPR-associated protein Cse1/CasA n=1 Tax=Brachybacterium hainanense TaxID=1541174 RepID=A0ABV6R898_9MICO
MDDTASFSLITEPWIRCQLADGSERLLSLTEVFDGSVRILGLRGDSPTQDYAVLRILLAIFWRAHRHETAVAPGETFEFFDWREDTWLDAEEHGPDDAALEYLEKHADRFDLLHPEHPFMQVRELHTAKGGSLSASRLVPEAEQSYFSMRAGQGLESLSLPEAARWLIHAQAYDYSGIKSGAVGDDRVKNNKGYPIGIGWTGATGGTTILGRTLRETFVLNTAPEALVSREGDQPVWERDPDGPAQRARVEPAGPADLATWQSRRIRLDVTDGRVVSVLVSNGDQIPRAFANVLHDPMTPYRFSSNKSTKTEDVFYPRPYDTDRMMWRSLEPLLALEGDVDLKKKEKPGLRPATLEALGKARRGKLAEAQQRVSIRLTSASYGPQQSSASTTVDTRIEIPLRLLDEDSPLLRRAVLDTARSTMDAGIALGSFGGRLLLAAGGDYTFQATQTDAVLADLEPYFRRWLRSLDPATDLEPALASWQRTVWDMILDRAKVLLRGAGPKALIGREITQNDRTRTETAGTAYAQLQRDLRKALRLLPAPPSRTESPKETADV